MAVSIHNGIQLHLSDKNVTGYKYVFEDKDAGERYQARIQGEHAANLGSFPTAVAAAYAVALHLAHAPDAPLPKIKKERESGTAKRRR